MAEKQPANHLSATSFDGDCQVAAHRKVSHGHAMVGRVVPVVRVLGDVVAAHDTGALEGGLEHTGVARHRKLRERLAGYPGDGVKRVSLTAVIQYVVEKRAEL